MQTEVRTIKAARKAHSCSWCAQRIEAGQPYKSYRWFDGGDAATVKQHSECYDAMMGAMKELGDSFIEFSPGDNPRGCFCNFCSQCEHCKTTGQGMFKSADGARAA